MRPEPTKRRREQRWLVGLAVGAILIGLFYWEENWRGQRAWELCKRRLKVRKVQLNWTDYIPAPVPDDQNVFGVPEMRMWFNGTSAVGWRDLARNLPSPTFPGLNINSNTARMLVAEVTIGLPGTPAPNGCTLLRWGDPNAREVAAGLLQRALGPVSRAPQSPIGVGLMLRSPKEVQPAAIFLQCQTVPSEQDLRSFLPDSIVHATPGLAERVLRFEPDGDRSYRVTMPHLARAADFLTWSDGLEPQFALIRQALRRPCSRMEGFYENPRTIPGPNFRAVRSLAQALGARAQCHLLLGQPEEALRDLTLIHDFCRRIFEEQKPMTLLTAMVNSAVRGLYVAQIAEGLRLRAWRDSQLAELEQQLKTADVLSPVKLAFHMDAVVTFHTLELVPSAGFVKKSALAGLCPRGWGYQRLARRVRFDFDRVAGLDTASQIVFPDKVEAAGRTAQTLDHWSPFTFVASLEPVNIARAGQNAAHVQAQIEQALVACALERCRLADGEYPERLDAMVPKFLDTIPHDVIAGRPLHYRRAAGGTFTLYSIGWNGSDDGGVPGPAGDWVWPD